MNKQLKTVLQTIAINIRTLRKEQGLSQEGLAEQTGLHRTYVGAVERAERNVTLLTLCSFAKALNTSLPELLTNMREKTP